MNNAWNLLCKYLVKTLADRSADAWTQTPIESANYTEAHRQQQLLTAALSDTVDIWWNILHTRETGK